MKNRDYKIFAPNNYYHVYNRGVGKQDIFLDDEDRKFFLNRLKENLFPAEKRVPLLQGGKPSSFVKGKIYIRKTLPTGAFSLISYCLMPNHFHFLIRQNENLPISKLIAKLCTGYSMYFNKKTERVGSLFQGAFKAILVDSDSYLLWLTAYIHQNPTTAGLVKNPEDYQWSSYLDYIESRNGMLCAKDSVTGQFSNIAEYRKFVEESFEKIKQRKELEYLLLD